jgi:hypothetical protein
MDYFGQTSQVTAAGALALCGSPHEQAERQEHDELRALVVGVGVVAQPITSIVNGSRQLQLLGNLIDGDQARPGGVDSVFVVSKLEADGLSRWSSTACHFRDPFCSFIKQRLDGLKPVK